MYFFKIKTVFHFSYLVRGFPSPPTSVHLIHLLIGLAFAIFVLKELVRQSVQLSKWSLQDPNHTRLEIVTASHMQIIALRIQTLKELIIVLTFI